MQKKSSIRSAFVYYPLYSALLLMLNHVLQYKFKNNNEIVLTRYYTNRKKLFRQFKTTIYEKLTLYLCLLIVYNAKAGTHSPLIKILKTTQSYIKTPFNVN